jgi:hypothetical protein
VKRFTIVETKLSERGVEAASVQIRCRGLHGFIDGSADAVCLISTKKESSNRQKFGRGVNFASGWRESVTLAIGESSRPTFSQGWSSARPSRRTREVAYPMLGTWTFSARAHAYRAARLPTRIERGIAMLKLSVTLLAFASVAIPRRRYPGVGHDHRPRYTILETARAR